MLLPILTSNKDELKIWTFSDTHQEANVGDLQRAVIEMDALGFDIALGLGDYFSSYGTEAQGINIVSELNNFTNKNISDVYSIGGNHDFTGESNPNGSDYYYKKYIDPLGDNPATSLIINANRPYPVNGNYNSYYIEIGNLLIIMLGDKNDGDPPMGRDGLLDTDLASRRASGGISSAQWTWFKNIIESNKNKNIIVCSHQAIKDTNIGSGYDEFFPAYNNDVGYTYPASLHGDVDEAKRAGYIAYIEGVVAETEIDTWLTTNGKYIDLWMHGHYHYKIGETWNGRGRICEKYGTTFINVAQINHTYGIFYTSLESKSNLITIKGNTITSETYVHENYGSAIPEGKYEPMTVTVPLKAKFKK